MSLSRVLSLCTSSFRTVRLKLQIILASSSSMGKFDALYIRFPQYLSHWNICRSVVKDNFREP
ncbi:hypothetical protein CW304_27975 [Bacillus sp. UFRGS-B20]|nr:hypothetical protein CW304_27975 [Bacillus sp. UFRGS-B20]